MRAWLDAEKNNLSTKNRAKEIAQQIKHSLPRHEDLSVDPQHHPKARSDGVCLELQFWTGKDRDSWDLPAGLP